MSAITSIGRGHRQGNRAAVAVVINGETVHITARKPSDLKRSLVKRGVAEATAERIRQECGAS